jgi:hypothetical protein
MWVIGLVVVRFFCFSWEFIGEGRGENENTQVGEDTGSE